MNLKKYLDAANAAEESVATIAAQIDAHFEAGENQKALELRPKLDEAKAQAQGAHQLYLSMLNANSGGSDPAQRFVPGNVQVVTDEADQPFAGPGEFFRAVKIAGLYPGREDPRLRPMKVKDATGMSEGVPADGGYLIPPQTASGILEKMYNTGEILRRINTDPVTGNSMTYNGVDESSRADGSRNGGVRGYWLAEGGTITGSKPTFHQVDLKLKGVAALCYATDEQLEDTPNLESWLGRVVPDELRFKAEDAIFEGDGVGKPLGILAAPCLVSVLRTDANLVQLADINKMWARRYVGARDYAWFINQDVGPQLDGMTAATAPVYLPDGNVAGTPFGTLKGRPVIEVEYASTMGTVGDIVLASMSQYQAIGKAGGIKAASSIHVAFVTNETAFRFVYRIDGAPLWNSALTPFKGTNTVSPFVTLTSASS